MQIVYLLLKVSNILFLIYLLVYVLILVTNSIVGSIKLNQMRKSNRLYENLPVDFPVPISIIVPVFNESITAVQTIHTLLKQEYSQFEIVIIDDGSKDNTKQLILDEFHLVADDQRPIQYKVPCKPIREVYIGMAGNNIPIILAHKENGGSKADANNAGINICSYPYFVAMDGDEILQSDALKRASRAMLEEENLIGLGGNIEISNSVSFCGAMPEGFHYGRNLVSDMQVLEYGRAFIGSRIAHDIINSNLIVSGGYGLFNKQYVIDVGGYDPKSLGEDMELTMKLHEYCLRNHKKYSMRYIPDSVCWTQAPETLSDLKKQRSRWHCGLMQTMWKYKKMLFNPKYGPVGMLMLPYMLFYELLCPVFFLIGWVVLSVSALLHVFNPVSYVAVLGIYILLGILLTMNAFISKQYMNFSHITFKDILYFLLVALADSLFFRPFLILVGFGAFFRFKRIIKKWDSPKRVQIVGK